MQYEQTVKTKIYKEYSKNTIEKSTCVEICLQSAASQSVTMVSCIRTDTERVAHLSRRMR